MPKVKSKPGARAKTAAPLITLTPPASIPLCDLVLSPDNVRTIYDPAAIESLADSIARRGLLQSLSVRPVVVDGVDTGHFAVQAGGRRFRALTLLVKRRRLAADAPVPCIVKNSGVVADDSLAENADRVGLHPIDEFHAFSAMKAADMSDGDIAAAYRVTPALVRQRLRLSSASPVLLQAYRDEEIDLEDLMAYCLVDDHARQERVFEQMSAKSYGSNPYDIKRALTETTVPASDKRVRFVGLDTYVAAGGVVLRDLFDEKHQGYLQDPDLLARLVNERLTAAREDYLAQGWAWVEAAPEIPHDQRQGLSRLAPSAHAELSAEQEKRIADIEARLEELGACDDLAEDEQAEVEGLEDELAKLQDFVPVYAREDMATGGVFISIGYQGDLCADTGYVRGAPAQADGGHTGVPDADDDPAGKPLPERLVQDLTSYRTSALRDALSQDFRIAFTAVLHAIALKQFYTFEGDSCLQLSTQRSFPAQVEGFDDWKPTRDFHDRDRAWKDRLPNSAGDLWAALLAMDDICRQKLFAHCTAATVNAVREPHNKRPGAIGHANQLQMALGLHMVAAGWTTTAANYFARVPKDRIIAAVREGKDDRSADLIVHLKKGPMAAEAERLLAGTGWLPEPLRCADATNPEADGGLPAFLAENGDAQPDA